MPEDFGAAPRTLVIATGNAGKVREFQSLLAPAGLTLLTPADIGFAEEVEETGDTLRANALIKARALAARTSHPVLSDDSGLEVDALGGAPGVYSARYATAEEAAGQKQAAANRAKLLRAMQGKTDRAARFRCTLCYLEPGAEPRFYEGVCEGEIIGEERGEGGFGYDALFIPLGFNRTFGELPEPVKERLSHRGQATRAFLAELP
jgi:XTP/dITP diphosphohydrolase